MDFIMLYARINGSLEPTLLKTSPVFTFDLDPLTPRFTSHSPYVEKNKVQIHPFKYILGSRFTTSPEKYGADSPGSQKH